MRLKELQKVLPLLMQEGEVPILVGPAGIGKTQIIRQIAATHRRKAVILILSQMEPGDLLGMPYYDAATNTTKYAEPEWWPSEQTILFFDEINRASRHIRNAVMQLILDKEINGRKLPQGTWIVAAMNPTMVGEDIYETNEIFDPAFIDRFIWLKVTPTFEDWLDYQLQHRDEIESEFIAAVAALKDEADIEVMYAPTDFELPPLRPTPRALERAARIYRALVTAGVAKHLVLETIAGIVGPNVAAAILKRLEQKPTYTFQQLIAGEVPPDNATSIDKIVALKRFIKAAANDELSDKEINAAGKVVANHYSLEEAAVAVREMLYGGNDEAWARWRSQHPIWSEIVKKVLTADGTLDVADVWEKL